MRRLNVIQCSILKIIAILIVFTRDLKLILHIVVLRAVDIGPMIDQRLGWALALLDLDPLGLLEHRLSHLQILLPHGQLLFLYLQLHLLDVQVVVHLSEVCHVLAGFGPLSIQIDACNLAHDHIVLHLELVELILKICDGLRVCSVNDAFLRLVGSATNVTHACVI